MLRTVAVAVAVAVGAGVLFLFDPAQTGWYPPCPSRLITGLHCPGCGTLRALHRLFHGDLVGACSYNVAAVAAIPVLLWYGASSIRVRRGEEPLPGCGRLGRSGAWIAAILIVYAILRNLPWAPFTILAPG